MSPSPEARELLQDRRRMVRAKPIFTERRSLRRRMWDRAWPCVALLLVFAWWCSHRLFT